MANIEYREKSFFGHDYDCIVTGPHGIKTFYGKESRDEADDYYRSEKILEDEIALRQKQSDLADMQMREIKERERRDQEERFRSKDTSLRFNGGMSPNNMFQRPPALTPFYDPEYLEFLKWKKENDPEYAIFKQEKAREKAEANWRKVEEEARKQKEQEHKIIVEAKELLKKAKKQVQIKNISIANVKINEIEELVEKETYTDSLMAIELLKKQHEWKFNEKETFSASLYDFDNSKKIYEENRINTFEEVSELLNKIKCSTKKDKKGQTAEIIGKIKELLKKETFNDSLEAINLSKNIYTWKRTKGRVFEASLLNFDQKLSAIQKKEREENQRINLLEEKQLEKQETNNSGCGSIIAFIIILSCIIIFIIQSC